MNKCLRLSVWSGIGVALVLAARPAPGCDTPVYRYAMYRWTPTPYEVYFFHEDFWGERKYTDQQTRFMRSIESAAENTSTPSNVAFIPVNVFADPELRSVPPDVRKLWRSQSSHALPNYLLVSPQGSLVHSGSMKPEDTQSLISSPSRERISDMLSEGRSGVFILLTGQDEKANKVAENVLDELARDVAAGKVDLYKGPKNTGEPAEKLSGVAESKQQIGVVKLNRDNPAERWLVAMLLSIETDLKDKEFEKDPMIFVAYGRARALPPYIGKGISRDNLLEVLAFITGACSCTVKEQNPGVDLLTRYDWATAAEKLADKFGSEEGNESFYGPDEFFPELLVGQSKTDAKPSTGEGTNSARADNGGGNDGNGGKSENVPDPGSSHTVNDAGQGPEHGEEKDPRAPTDASTDAAQSKPNQVVTEQPTIESSRGTKQVALNAEASGQRNSAASETAADNSWMLTLAAGVGVGLFVLIGATLVLFRRR